MPTYNIASGSYLNYILDQLSDLDNFTFRKMFGGIGFYRDDQLFGAIAGGKFRLRSPAECKGECAGESLYFDKMLIGEGPFCAVPDRVLQDKELLQKWAERSYRVVLHES